MFEIIYYKDKLFEYIPQNFSFIFQTSNKWWKKSIWTVSETVIDFGRVFNIIKQLDSGSLILCVRGEEGEVGVIPTKPRFFRAQRITTTFSNNKKSRELKIKRITNNILVESNRIKKKWKERCRRKPKTDRTFRTRNRNLLFFCWLR